MTPQLIFKYACPLSPLPNRKFMTGRAHFKIDFSIDENPSLIYLRDDINLRYPLCGGDGAFSRRGILKSIKWIPRRAFNFLASIQISDFSESSGKNPPGREFAKGWPAGGRPLRVGGWRDRTRVFGGPRPNGWTGEIVVGDHPLKSHPHPPDTPTWGLSVRPQRGPPEMCV